jgi:hypothetical protein
MSSLEALANLDTEHPSAAIWNRLLREIAKRLPQTVLGKGPGTPFRYPFQVTVQPWTQAPSNYPPGRIWQLFVRSAMINDQPVTMIYYQQNDPRGWVMPKGYPAKTNTAGPPNLIDRPLYDATIYPDDPPFLALTAPSANLKDMGGFAAVPDNLRPAFFCSSDMAPLALYESHVSILMDTGAARLYIPTLPTILRRYRVFVGGLPSATVPYAGGSVEIARIYLTRDQNANDPVATDQLYVQQKVYWNLVAMYVQFGVPLLNLADAVAGASGPIGDLFAQAITEELTGLGYMGFWSC